MKFLKSPIGLGIRFCFRVLSCVIPVRKLRVFVRDIFDYRSPRNLKKYFRRVYVPLLKNMEVVEVGPKSEYVFSCWLQGMENAPDIVKKCVDSVDKFSLMNGKKHIIITKDNFSKWVELPQFIIDKWERGIISNAHFSDVLRLCLLSEYGGYWIDATCLMSGDFPLWLDNCEFFMFHSHGVYSYTVINNCFIYSLPHHYLIDAWKFLMFEFWKNENQKYHYFFSHFLFCAMIKSDERARAEYNKMPEFSQVFNHELFAKFVDAFDDEKFKEIFRNSFVHKLTYKYEKEYRHMAKNSFLDFILTHDLEDILKAGE